MLEELRREIASLRSEVNRLSAIADVQQITQVVMSYGPLVDAGSAEATADLWAPDGVYEVDGVLTMEGHEQIASMVLSENHQGFINNGAAHVLTSPRVCVDGDTAEAFNHALLLTLSNGTYSVARISANMWTLHRQGHSWCVERRINRPLDGRSSSRELFAQLSSGRACSSTDEN